MYTQYCIRDEFLYICYYIYMPTFNHNNGEIYYETHDETHGEGEPIVLIHGFALDSRVWQGQVKELSQTNKVITYDLRGFGKSSLPNGKYSHHEDLHELLKHLDIKEAKLVGHSFGGEVAVNFALEYPEEVSSLILISSSLGGVEGDSSEWEILQELGRQGDVEGMRKRMFVNPAFKDLKDSAKELVGEIIQDYSGYHFQNKDPREYINSTARLHELSLPVEVVVAEKDLEVQKEVVETFERKLRVKPRVIPKTGHMVILEEQDAVNNIIKEEITQEYHSEHPLN
jgi:3-oxoadipate enol-lactonase